MNRPAFIALNWRRAAWPLAAYAEQPQRMRRVVTDGFSRAIGKDSPASPHFPRRCHSLRLNCFTDELQTV